jgi:hypothetical protein
MGFGLKGIANAIRMWLHDGENAAVSDADEVAFRYKTSLDRCEFSENGGAYRPLGAAGGLVFADIAAMAAYADTALPDGAVCEVATLLCSWELVRFSPIAPNGITVVAPSSGVGRWHRRDNLGNTWVYRSTWTIDQIAGDDENFGDVGAPLETHDELVRRIGGHLGEGAGTITIDFVGNYTGNIDWAGSNTLGGVILVYVGVRTVLHLGTVTARTVYNTATSTIGNLTDAALPATWTVSGYVGCAIKMDTGLLTGYVGWLQKDVEPVLATRTVQYQQPIDVATFTVGDPGVGDGYEIFSTTVVTGFVRFAGRMIVTMSDFQVHGAGGFNICLVVQDKVSLTANTCLFEEGVVYASYGAVIDFVGCRFASTISNVSCYPEATIYLDGCAIECTLYSQGKCYMSTFGGIQIWTASTSWCKGALTEAGWGSITLMSGTWWGAFDFPDGSSGLVVELGAEASLLGLFWGVGGVGHTGLSVITPGMIRYTTLPTYGPNAVSDCSIDGLTCAYADLPVVVPMKMSGIVSYP